MNRYEKALKKIKESEKCKPNLCCCSIVGPTGQQGEAGGVLNFADFYACHLIMLRQLHQELMLVFHKMGLVVALI